MSQKYKLSWRRGATSALSSREKLTKSTKTAAESRRVTADITRDGLVVCDRKALLLQISGDAMEADFMAAWLGRCLQEKCPPDGSDKKKRQTWEWCHPWASQLLQLLLNVTLVKWGRILMSHRKTENEKEPEKKEKRPSHSEVFRRSLTSWLDSLQHRSDWHLTVVHSLSLWQGNDTTVHIA